MPLNTVAAAPADVLAVSAASDALELLDTEAFLE